MAEDISLKPFVDACETYRREVAVAQIDYPLGEARATRIDEAVQRGAAVCTVGALQVLQQDLAAASAASTSWLRRLRAWGLDMHVRGVGLPHQRQVRAQQRVTTCVVDEQRIPLGSCFAAMAAENRRDRRMAIEEAVAEQLEATNTLLETQYADLRRAGEALGYASLNALWTDVLPVEPTTLQDEALCFLEETRDVYTDLLVWAVRHRLNIPPGQLRRHDILALFTMPAYQRYYQPGSIISALQQCLFDMAIDTRADGRLALRQCPAEFGLAAAMAVQIPHEVVVTYSHVSGVKGAEAYASAYGQALQWAYTSAELPLVMRLLEEPAFPVSGAQLLAQMVASPGWLHRYLRVTVDADYWLWHRLDRLYRLRRQLGRFLYAQHLSTAESLAGADEAYREIMMDACQVAHHPAYYLVDWDWTYMSVAFFRGWKLAYRLLDTLQQQFSYDWFRNPDSGLWLSEYWQDALGETMEALQQEVGGGPWEVTEFAAYLVDEATW